MAKINETTAMRVALGTATSGGDVVPVSAAAPLSVSLDGAGAASSRVQGNVAAGVADAGDPVKVGGVYLAAFPALANGQRSNFQTDRRGAQYVQSLGSRTYATGQAALPATPGAAVLIAAARAERISIAITPTAATVFYIGGAGVTVATGHYVPAGQSITLNTADAVYGVGADGVTVSYIELY